MIRTKRVYYLKNKDLNWNDLKPHVFISNKRILEDTNIYFIIENRGKISIACKYGSSEICERLSYEDSIYVYYILQDYQLSEYTLKHSSHYIRCNYLSRRGFSEASKYYILDELKEIGVNKNCKIKVRPDFGDIIIEDIVLSNLKVLQNI